MVKVSFWQNGYWIKPPIMPNKLRGYQRAMKVVSDSPGLLVDFAFGLVNSVLNLSDGQVNFLGKFKLQKNGNQSC